MEDAEGYLELIRGDPFLGRMLASYERASKRGRNLDVLDYGCGYGWGSYVLSEFCSRVTGYDPDEQNQLCGAYFYKGKYPVLPGRTGPCGTML